MNKSSETVAPASRRSFASRLLVFFRGFRTPNTSPWTLPVHSGVVSGMDFFFVRQHKFLCVLENDPCRGRAARDGRGTSPSNRVAHAPIGCPARALIATLAVPGPRMAGHARVAVLAYDCPTPPPPPPPDNLSVSGSVTCVASSGGWCSGGATLDISASDSLGHNIAISPCGGNPCSVALPEGSGDYGYSATCTGGQTANRIHPLGAGPYPTDCKLHAGPPNSGWSCGMVSRRVGDNDLLAIRRA